MALNFASNNSLSAITTLPASISGGGMTLISEQTASSSATIDFTSNIDSTYDVYVFKFINMHPATNNVEFQVNFRDGDSNFDATKTTTTFRAFQDESGSTTSLGYDTATDLAQSTSFQAIGNAVGNGNDECYSGELRLFNPSSTTFVKHFISTGNLYHPSDFSVNEFVAGYCNVTSAIDGVQFKMSSGNIDSGKIKLYGIKDS
jgi:hypothetical protein